MKLLQAIANSLVDTPLFEMAFERKKALQTIRGMAVPLAHHLLLVTHCAEHECQNHWENEINSFLETIQDHTYLKKKARLTVADLKADLWDGPLGEYEDYARLLAALEKRKGIKLKAATPEAYSSLKDQYDVLVKLLLSSTAPNYKLITGSK